jgi:hypothetical protein
VRRRLVIALCYSGLVLQTERVSGQIAAADSAPIMSTGITGTLTASGLESPTYALSFRPVQQVILESTRGPIDSARATALLRGSPVGLTDLLRLGLLRSDGSRLRLNYLVLTVADQRAIYDVGERYGADLAKVIRSHRGSLFDSHHCTPTRLFGKI